jgi:MFS family permease
MHAACFCVGVRLLSPSLPLCLFLSLSLSLCVGLYFVATGLGGSIYESTFGMAASSTFSFDPKLLGLLQTTAAVLGLFTNSFFVGFLERRLGAHRLMASAAATLAALALLYSQAEGQGEVAGSKRFGLHTTWYVFGIASSMSLPSACIYTSITSLLSKASDSDNTATVIGLGHAARSAVGIVGPSVGGFLLEKHGTAGVGFATAAVMSCAGVFLLLAKASLQGVQGVDNDRAATHVTEKKKT